VLRLGPAIRPLKDAGFALMKASVPRSLMARVRRSGLAVVLSGLVLAGCASGDTGASEPWDPIETPNRFIFALNRTVDMVAVRPVAVVYRDWVPEGAQKSVRNMLDNLGEPVTAINEVFQGDPGRAATTMARFLVNSTIGLAGLFDVAAMWGMKRTKEDAGITIGMWAGKGVEPENGGFYMVLPLVGPSNIRDATGLMIDYAVDPFQILPIAFNWSWWYTTPRFALNVIDYRSRTMFALDDLEKNSVDYYAALKSAYTQNRAELIRQKREKTDAKAELERRDNLALAR
jgi:phospholipid-binding lipoprotein MlaA